MRNVPNLVLIVLDTMRLDAMFHHGVRRTTPQLDSFYKTSVSYQNAISPSSWTLPSHVSMFTGKFQFDHKIHETYSQKADYLWKNGLRLYGHSILPEELKKLGYNTIGISANPMVSSITGFERGFNYFALRDAFHNVYEKEIEMHGFLASLREKSLVNKETNHRNLAFQLIKKGRFRDVLHLYRLYNSVSKDLKIEDYPYQKGAKYVTRELQNSELEEPFFLFINLMEMHDPHIRKSRGNIDLENDNNIMLEDLFGFNKIPDRTMREIRAGYFQSVEILNYYLEQILSLLRRRSSYGNTLYVITSDHGQSLKEKDYFGHGIFLHDELIRVPLIVRYPDQMNHISNVIDNSYQNTKDLYHLFLNLAHGESEHLRERNSTISESYGIQHDIMTYFGKRMSDERIRRTRQSTDKIRRAVFKSGHKLVFNIEDEEIEEYSYMGAQKEVDIHDKNVIDLLNELKSITSSSNTS